MKKASIVFRSVLLPIFLAFQIGASLGGAKASSISAPVLKWEKAGCYSSWCQTGWYSSPAIADLDGNGTVEVIGAAYSVFLLNGSDGSLIDEIDTPGSRAWPGIVVADIDNDQDLEIVSAHGDGWLNVLDHQGNTVWSRQPVTRELRGLSVFDLDDDGTMEIVVTGACSSKVNTWVYDHDGNLKSGWPQLSDESGYAYGVFNDNAAVGDLDQDGMGEIVVPSDVHYICAYEADGSHISASADYGGKKWGAVGIWESLDTELRGWGKCDGDRAESYRTNFAHGPAAIADVNGDRIVEVVAVGNVYDCDVGHPPGKYNGVYVFNADRSRFNLDGFDWRQAPVDTGSPLSESYNEIESNQPNPVVADIDGDCRKEILFSSYDGRVHCFWLDKTERHFWPYDVNIPSDGFVRFASEPVVADFDNDGYAEVLFASWVEKGSDSTGKLHILDYRGTALHETDLPMAHGSPDWNGVLPAPTLGNIDSDEDLEVVLNSAHSGFLAYDLPGTDDARILWGTGRGNFLRNAFVDPDDTPPVSADFDANATEGTEPFAVTFTPDCAGCVDTWEWDFGDGGQGHQSSSPVHAFYSVNDQTTSYTVSLTSSNAHESDTATKTDYIVVHPCGNAPVRIQANPQETSETLQDAYDTLAEDGDIIDVQAFEYQGPHDFSRNIFVVINGGLNCSYNSSKAPAVLQGPVSIRRKGLEFRGIAIQ